MQVFMDSYLCMLHLTTGILVGKTAFTSFTIVLTEPHLKPTQLIF